MAIATPSGNFFTKKLGPLPMWAWIGIGVAALLVLSSYKSKFGKNVNTPNNGTQPAYANLPPGTALDPQSLTVVNEGYNPPAITINNPAPTGTPPVVGRSPGYSVSDFTFKKFLRDPNSGAIYGEDPNNTLIWLSPDMYKSLGTPAFTDIRQTWGDAGNPVALPAPPSPPPAAPQQRVVTVTPWSAGNTSWSSTLSGIAQHFYGDPQKYGYLAQVNGIQNPDLIYPGQKIIVP